MREELWHPLFSHIPLALLALVPFVRTFELIKKDEQVKKHTQVVYLFCLYIGLAFYTLSIFLGDIAADHVRPQLSHHQNLNAHEELGYWCLGWYILALINDAIFIKFKWVKHVTLVFLLLGLIQLIRVGHLGAKLVYEQGAGVLTQ